MAEKKLTETQERALKSFGESLDSETATQEFISKAATTGLDINPDELAGVPALRRQFLDSRVTQLSFDNSAMKFFAALNKTRVGSTVVEYDTFDRHGEVGHSAFDTEVGLSAPSDPAISRRIVRTKSISATRSVSIIAQAVDNIAQPVQIYTDDAITSLVKTIEWASFYGDSSLTDAPDQGYAQGLEFDGLAKQIDSDNVINAHGSDLTPQLLNEAALKIAKGYGTPTDVFMPLGAQANFVNQFLPNQRFFANGVNGAEAQGFTAGFNLQEFASTVGNLKLNGSAVMENDTILDEVRLGGKGAPAPATVDTPKVNKADNGAFADADLGDLHYAVTLSADKGQSVPVKVDATLDAKDSTVSLNIKFPSTYENTPKFASIYRQDAVSGQYYLIARVGANKAQGGVIAFKDANETIPGTVDVFVGELSPMTLQLFELLPMMSLPLPSQTKTLNWAVIWNGALALKAPKRWAQIHNVGYTAVKPTF